MADVELLPCGECGMPCRPDEYHPFAACLMFKACHNSETVRANMEALRAERDALKAEIERLRKLHQDAYQRGFQAGSSGLREMYDAAQQSEKKEPPSC